MRCKIGGDDWKNKEGYILIDGLLICSDWDVDCTQCLVEKCLELANKWRLPVDPLKPQPIDKAVSITHAIRICAKELEDTLDISELVAKQDE